MLCYFLLYRKVSQLYIYMYVSPVFFRLFAHIGLYRVLSRVPCAIQQVLISYLFYLFLVQSLSHVWLFVTPWTTACKFLCPPLSPGVCSNSCPLNWWCYLTISFSVACFFFCLQPFPASGSFPVSRFFTSCVQSIRAPVSASVLPMNTQDWFPLRLTSLISLLSKGLSRVFSNVTMWKHQFFGTQPSLWSNSHIRMWL